LPGCAAQATADVIREIFKSKNAALTALNNMTTVSESSTQQNCHAHIETAAETGTIFYTITLQGDKFQVLITKVDARRR
jgi:Flp pilus assembly protein TadG